MQTVATSWAEDKTTFHFYTMAFIIMSHHDIYIVTFTLIFKGRIRPFNTNKVMLL